MATLYVHSYFVYTQQDEEHLAIVELEEMMYTADGTYWMAQAGRIENGNGAVLKHYTELGDFDVYLRREVDVLADCVRLSYGDVPTDCPVLWVQMGEYIQDIANIFQVTSYSSPSRQR